MQLFSSNFKLGILGGGQLGKMLLYDAKRYDLHTKVMDSNKQVKKFPQKPNSKKIKNSRRNNQFSIRSGKN